MSLEYLGNLQYRVNFGLCKDAQSFIRQHLFSRDVSHFRDVFSPFTEESCHLLLLWTFLPILIGRLLEIDILVMRILREFVWV